MDESVAGWLKVPEHSRSKVIQISRTSQGLHGLFLVRHLGQRYVSF